MQTLAFTFPAVAPPRGRALAGVVASGDLEVLLEPAADARITIEVTTSVEGMERTWAALFARLFAEPTRPAVHLQINDFGATPGVVGLRIAQAFDAVAQED
jgi:malonate decarboxylase delta subunit